MAKSNNSAVSTVLSVTNVETERKHVDGLVAAAIKSSVAHHKEKLVPAVQAAFMFMTVHGQIGPMNKLLFEVNKGDQEAIRFFGRNVVTTFADKFKTSEGKMKVGSFFNYSLKNGFGLEPLSEMETGTEDQRKHCELARTMKRKIIAAAEGAFLQIAVGRAEDDTSNNALADIFDTGKKVRQFLETLARNGEKSLALQLNRAAGDFAIEVGAIDKIAADNDPKKKWEDAQAKADAAKANYERSRKPEAANGDAERQAAVG